MSEWRTEGLNIWGLLALERARAATAWVEANAAGMDPQEARDGWDIIAMDGEVEDE